KTTPARDHFTRGRRIGIKKIVQVEAFRGHFPDCIHSVAQQLPKRFRVTSSGEPAADPDDGDRFGSCLLGLASRGGKLLQVWRLCQVAGESLDSRTLVCQLSRKLSSQPCCEFTRKAHQLR